MSGSAIRRSALALLAVTGLALPAAAGDVPAVLPDPDGKPGDAAKPVKVYILAGQSNMVGFGQLAGARCPYAGIFLTPDPAAPAGPLYVYKVGSFLIRPLRVTVSADADAKPGATVSIYKGAYDAGADYGKAGPVKTETVALGVSTGMLPTVDGPHVAVARGQLEVPVSGTYTMSPGHGNSAHNVMVLDGKEVYRRNAGEQATRQEIALEAGRRYPFTITYFQGGSTALWASRKDLTGNGDLELLTKRDKKYPWLIDAEGKWTVRHDVYFQEARLSKDGKGSLLSPTSNGKFIGPELGFGHVIGTYHEEQVLLIKTAQGNRSLGFDFRPPSSGRTDPDNEFEAAEYRLMVEGVRKTLDRIDTIVPGYKGQGYEIAGFVWWQGHKDAGATQAEYEKHLVNLIQDLRKEFKSPRMPATIATVGFGGHNISEDYLKILKAQMAVGDPEKHPEFAGTVASVDTRGFWREADESPSNPGYHYNKNAETYLLTGDALGRAMVRLLGGKAEPLPDGNQPKPAAKPEPAAPATEPTPEQRAAAKAALAPILLDGILPVYVANPRYQAALRSEAAGEKPKRTTQFLRGAMFGLTEIYRAAGIHDYDWRPFGQDLRTVEWEYFSFDPPETLPREKGDRFRKVTLPEGMERWFAPDFDAAKPGWKKGLPPFGQLDGKTAPLSETCTQAICGCGTPPKTLWEKEVLLIRGTFEIPPPKAGHRYRLVVGGSAHVNAGEGYAIYVNGKLLAESKSGVGKRQGAQPRGGHIYKDFREALRGGKVTLAAISFLRYNHPRDGVIPPRGHFSLWLEEQKLPPLGPVAPK